MKGRAYSDSKNNIQPLIELPIYNRLSLIYVLSLTIAILVIGVSCIGIIFSKSIYPSEDILVGFLPTDYANLVIGIPFLLISMILVKYKKMVGLISWASALFYMVYVYMPYMISVPFGPLFLPYLLIVTLSIYTLVGLLLTIDLHAVKKQLNSKVPEKPIGGLLGGLGLLIIVRQIAMIITALLNESQIDIVEVSVWIDDFIIAVPTLLISSILIWKKRSLGYIISGGVLLAYGILSLELIPLMIYQANRANTDIDIAGIIIVIVMALICIVPFTYFVRGTRGKVKYKK